MEAATTLLATLFYFVLCSSFLVPSLTVLVCLAESSSRSILFILWKHFGNHFAWPSASDEFPPPTSGSSGPITTGPFDYRQWVFDGKQGTRRYRRGGAPEEEQAMRCVFCLCDIEDGEEVRELRCEHLFHSSCLDRWVAYGRVTCPLCRTSLASKVAEAELPCEEDAELGSSVLMFVVHLHGAWWML